MNITRTLLFCGIFSLTIKASAQTNAKSTATASRMVAHSGYSHDGTNYVIADTGTYVYSGERPGDANSKAPNRTGIDPLYDTWTIQDDKKYIRTYDANDNVLEEVVCTWDNLSSTWLNYKKFTNTYDLNNNRLIYKEQSWQVGLNDWYNMIQYVATYDVNNNRLTDTKQVFSSGTWHDNQFTIRSYDTDNKLVSEVFQNATGVNDNQILYSYDVNNDLVEQLSESWVSGSWQNGNRMVKTYDADHHTLTHTVQLWNGTWLNYVKLSYTYTGDDITTFLRQEWNGVDTWLNISRAIYTHDGNHNCITELYQVYNVANSVFQDHSRQHLLYNSYDQLTCQWNEYWLSGTWQVNSANTKKFYYYGEYDVVGLNSVTTNTDDIKIYPVPAVNFVRIGKTCAQPQDFTVSITDMQGRMVRTYAEKATTNYAKTIDVSQLPSGNYFVKIAAAGGKASYQQFSIMH